MSHARRLRASFRYLLLKLRAMKLWFAKECTNVPGVRAILS